jgi:hypothetical protein
MNIIRNVAAATLMLGIVFGARLVLAQTSASQSCSGDPRISVGGVGGFASLADPAATASLRRSCVGLYIHAEGWKPIDDATKAAILANFKGTGPAAVELGFTEAPDGYFGKFYQTVFIDKGVNADTALINGLCKDGPDSALKYIAVAKRFGLTKVAVVFSPNHGQYKTAGFADPQFDCVRTAAKAGGALAIDSPPHVFFALKSGYQQFVMDEIRWANSNGIPTYFIISPNGSQSRLAQESNLLVDTLAANQAVPSNYVFEAYCKLCTDTYHQVGTENDPTSVVGVAKILLPKIAH